MWYMSDYRKRKQTTKKWTQKGSSCCSVWVCSAAEVVPDVLMYLRDFDGRLLNVPAPMSPVKIKFAFIALCDLDLLLFWHLYHEMTLNPPVAFLLWWLRERLKQISGFCVLIVGREVFISLRLGSLRWSNLLHLGFWSAELYPFWTISFVSKKAISFWGEVYALNHCTDPLHRKVGAQNDLRNKQITFASLFTDQMKFILMALANRREQYIDEVYYYRLKWKLHLFDLSGQLRDKRGKRRRSAAGIETGFWIQRVQANRLSKATTAEPQRSVRVFICVDVNLQLFTIFVEM